jgi:FkbM family methyltransferase
VIIENLPGAPFDLVFDVGGNVGDFAEAAVLAWPDAKVLSFEPLPQAAHASRMRSQGRWSVYELGISEYPDDVNLWFCMNQHSASTMQAPGTARREHFGIADKHEAVRVHVDPLDRYLDFIEGRQRVLVKIDVEGHEMHVLKGARRVLSLTSTVVCEVQQDPSIFLGSPSPHQVDVELRRHGLEFAGLADAFGTSPPPRVLQFDGIWTRDFATWRETPEQAGSNATWPSVFEKRQ